MPAKDINTRAWQIYGRRQLAHSYTPPVPDRLDWTPWEGIGPGAELLGDVTGRRVLDIGSGAGHHAAHLVQAQGARVTGIELSPTQHERAVSAHADVDGVEFVQGDVTEYLSFAEPFDAAYAIGTLAFIDPHRSLPALRDGLRPGAPVILSLLHTDLNGRGPSTEVAPREQMILLRDDPPLPTQMWVLAPQLWEDLLTEYGFRVEAIELLPHPDESATVVQQLIRARRLPARPARASSRPRSTRAPAAHAAVGVGAICSASGASCWAGTTAAFDGVGRMPGMGTDISGFIEYRVPQDGQEPTWYSAHSLSSLNDVRNYDAFGCLFGVRNYANFRPMAAGRGFPADASATVGAQFAQLTEWYGEDGFHGTTWITWAEVKAVDWDEPAEKPDRAAFTNTAGRRAVSG